MASFRYIRPSVPWQAYAEAADQAQGSSHAHFVGWEAWMGDPAQNCGDLLEPFGAVDRVRLYDLCCRLWQHRS